MPAAAGGAENFFEHCGQVKETIVAVLVAEGDANARLSSKNRTVISGGVAVAEAVEEEARRSPVGRPAVRQPGAKTVVGSSVPAVAAWQLVVVVAVAAWEPAVVVLVTSEAP